MKTYGYDYVFAVSVVEINQLLADKLSKLDLELEYSAIDKTSGSSITLNAKMLPWQIVKGGENQLLRFSISFSSGHLTIDGGPISNSYDLTGVTAIVEVSLGWVGSSNVQETKGSGDLTRLIFTSTGSDNSNESGYVSVVTILDANHQLDTLGVGLLRNYTTDILFANKDRVNYILADVFPEASNLGSWLKPYKWIYYYAIGDSDDALCFLCLLSDKEWPKNPAFDSTALTSSYNSTVLISQEVFFSNVVLPSIESALPNGKFSLRVKDEQATIENSGEFSINTSKGEIIAQSFELTTSDSGNGLKINTSGGGSLKFFFGVADLPNASYSWSCENTCPLQYQNNQLTFSRDEHPITHHDQTIHWYDWVILTAVGITSLPGLISVIVDSINDFSDTVNDVGIDNINNGLETAFGGSVVNLTNLIEWGRNEQTFNAAIAGLNGALYIYGNLK